MATLAPAQTFSQPDGTTTEPLRDDSIAASVACVPAETVLQPCGSTAEPLCDDAAPSSLTPSASVPGSFAEYLRGIDDVEERGKLACDYFRYKEAEAKWISENPSPKKRKSEAPSREYRCTRRRQNLAIGEAYLTWLRSPAGKASTAPLKALYYRFGFPMRSGAYARTPIYVRPSVRTFVRFC